MEGYAYRVSAAALKSRGLLRLSGRGPTWRAELTDAGRSVLTELDEVPVKPPRAAPRSRPQANARRATAPAALSKTEQLVADVIAAGGKLVLPDTTSTGGVNYRQRAYAAQRHGKVPDGQRLRVARTSAGFEIDLLAGETGNEIGADRRRSVGLGDITSACRISWCGAR